MKKIQVNRITQLNISSTQTLLEGMEQAGLEPEFQCRDGHCGACKCVLLSGEVEYVGFALAFTHPNEILPCICRAKTDVQLDGVHYQEESQFA